MGEEVTGASSAPVESAALAQENTAPDSSGHPAWQLYLDELPDDFTRAAVKPAFEKWDRNFQERLQKVHSEYEPLKPFQQYVGTDPRQIDAGLQLYRVLETNPQALYEQLRNYYGFGNEQGQAAEQQYSEESTYDLGEDQYGQLPPEVQQRLAQYEQVQGQVVNLLATQHEQQVQAEADSWLDAQIETLKTQHNIPEEHINMVLNQVHLKAQQLGGNANFDQLIAEAGAQYSQFIESVRGPQAQPAFAPRTITSSGGNGVPSNAVRPEQLDGKTRRQLMAEMLEKNLGQG